MMQRDRMRLRRSMGNREMEMEGLGTDSMCGEKHVKDWYVRV
jgi:hypothetical protein